MTFVDILGSGTTLQPAQVSYGAITLTANLTLVWPLEAASGTNKCALILDVTPSANGFTITLPSALLASVGSTVLIVNRSNTYTFSVNDAGGSVLTVVATGTAYYEYLRTNSTAAGTWGQLIFGGTSAPVNPALLAGQGLQVIGTTLNAYLPVVTRAATWNVDATTGRAIHNNYTGGAGLANLPAVATATNGFWFTLSNNGTGSLVLTPAGGETIDGSATLSIGVAEKAGVVCSGGAWFTFSLSRSILSTITRLSLTGLAGGTRLLTATEAANTLIYCTGTLLSDQNIDFPASVGRWFFSNACAGAFNLTARVTGGADPGTVIPAAEQRPVMSDGTNMIAAVTTTPIAPTSFAAGLVGAPSIYLTGTPSTGVYFPSTIAMAFVAGGSEVFRMAAAGLQVNGVSLTDASNNIPWARLSTNALPQIHAYSLGM